MCIIEQEKHGKKLRNIAQKMLHRVYARVLPDRSLKMDKIRMYSITDDATYLMYGNQEAVQKCHLQVRI